MGQLEEQPFAAGLPDRKRKRRQVPALQNTVNATPHVFVTDFDGTMTKYDFYAMVEKELLPPDVPDFWREYRAGRITHFEGLRNYFAAIRADEPTVLELVARMELDSQLAQSVAELRKAGWEIVIASAGCAWYIQQHLAWANVQLELHANPGRFISGRGLLMELPQNSPFFSHTHGIDKAAIVRHFLDTGRNVAFAGDGLPDVDAARLVSSDFRFARGDLAEVLTASQIPFQRFDTWSDIARKLIVG